MKPFRKLIFSFITIIAISSTAISYGQCTPGDSTTCPDPEDNGEICPKNFPPAIVNTPYSVEATILPPPSFTYSGTTVPIQKIVLKDVDNLPPGLTYQSNEPSGEFYPGTYYCVLLSGTPTDTGYYKLKIVVDAYIMLFGSPVYAGEQTDSTSIAITVQSSTNTSDMGNHGLLVDGPYPNPFKHITSFDIQNSMGKAYQLRIMDSQGRLVYYGGLDQNESSNYEFKGEGLEPGLYFYFLSDGSSTSTGKLIKN